MADNITIPLTGSGDTTKVVATDDCGAAGHAQLYKQAISTDGSATLIPADAANGLDVDVTRVGGNVATTAADGSNVAIGTTSDADTALTVIGRLKKLVALLAGGLPAALGTGGGVKVSIVDGGTGGGAVTVADGADVAQGTTTDATSVNTVIGRLKNLLSRWPAALGQTTKAGSISVTRASDEDALDVTGSVTVTGTMPTSPDSASVYAGATALTPKFAFANVAASTTDGNVVTAVASKKIRVLQVAVVAGATATNITFNSKPAGAGTAKTCLFANGANGGEVLPFSPVGWFETVAGEGLAVTTGAGSTSGILVGYVEV